MLVIRERDSKKLFGLVDTLVEGMKYLASLNSEQDYYELVNYPLRADDCFGFGETCLYVGGVDRAEKFYTVMIHAPGESKVEIIFDTAEKAETAYRALCKACTIQYNNFEGGETI